MSEREIEKERKKERTLAVQSTRRDDEDKDLQQWLLPLEGERVREKERERRERRANSYLIIIIKMES